MKQEGIDWENIRKIPMEMLKEMQTRGLKLNEAKWIISEMACILEQSEKYRPDTPLDEMVMRKN